MNRKFIKEKLDQELQYIFFDETMKNQVHNQNLKNKTYGKKYVRPVVAACIFVCLCGTVGFTYYMYNNITKVNNQALPEIGEMQVKTIKFPDMLIEDESLFYADFTDMDSFIEGTEMDILTTDLANENPYMLGQMQTDKKDYAIITVENYIIGDTSNYQYVEEENYFSYTHGSIFYSPVSLEIDLALSKEQLVNGWDTEYLGYYQFSENFTSEQGYKVNLIESKTEEVASEDSIVSEKCAIFIADGVRYTLKGRIPTETMKQIVDSFY